MTKFVVLAHEAPTRAKINLNNLAGEGRIDLVARTVNSALLKSHGIREENELFLIFQDELVIHFNGEEVGGVNPDERSIAGLLNRAIKQRYREGEKVSHGVKVKEKGLGQLLESFEEEVFVLKEGGRSLPGSGPGEDAVFVLSDHRDFKNEELEALNSAGAEEVSVGPEVIHTDDAVAVVNNFFDTAGFREYG
ncbi:MAG: tRNA (pseudouridine(54)-N(1))-methyltransferase TrmY [Candidatus Nanohalobium sp.]